eukprot:scaffold1839_cov382-Prasinococcus_capsulatus_cf.AAC.5
MTTSTSATIPTQCRGSYQVDALALVAHVRPEQVVTLPPHHKEPIQILQLSRHERALESLEKP